MPIAEVCLLGNNIFEEMNYSWKREIGMGTVQFVLLADDPSTFVTRTVPLIDIELAGIPGDRHYGLLRPADSRQKIYKRGTMIANRRQISIVSEEECALIAEK